MIGKSDIERLHSDPDRLDDLSPREFEELVASLLEFMGWKTSLTPQTRDGGFDVLAIQETLGFEVSWALECKKYNRGRKVGVDVVRSLYGVTHYLSIGNAAIVTTSDFTSDAREFVKQKPTLKLVDRAHLVSWLGQVLLQPEPAFRKERFQSVFVSHSHEDHEFAELLTKKLRENGVNTWFAPHDINPGEKIFESVFDAISTFDRLLVVLSDGSLKSQWVKTEIQKAFIRQRKEGVRVLFPVSITAYEHIKEWSHFDSDSGKDLGVELREYLIPEIAHWKNATEMDVFVSKILKGLKYNA